MVEKVCIIESLQQCDIAINHKRVSYITEVSLLENLNVYNSHSDIFIQASPIEIDHSEDKLKELN
ncbi:hypothetical protein [Providencia rustigianii]|uniref:hypothetical protein n=1 Tax=Providencia rustigianii TaxID=158850 RepID=UPI0022407202|nr:hypothetical protein [Providencia rustigianii]